jgi:hypothetical protein
VALDENAFGWEHFAWLRTSLCVRTLKLSAGLLVKRCFKRIPCFNRARRWNQLLNESINIEATRTSWSYKMRAKRKKTEENNYLFMGGWVSFYALFTSQSASSDYPRRNFKASCVVVWSNRCGSCSVLVQYPYWYRYYKLIWIMYEWVISWW